MAATASVDRVEALVATDHDPDLGYGDRDVLSEVKTAPGNVSLDSVLVEVAKLDAVRSVGPPADLFGDVAPKVVSGWRTQAAVESPSHLRDHSQPTRLVLLAALLFEREREITDALVFAIEFDSAWWVGVEAAKRVLAVPEGAIGETAWRESAHARVCATRAIESQLLALLPDNGADHDLLLGELELEQPGLAPTLAKVAVIRIE